MYFGLGSNLGDRANSIVLAVERLSKYLTSIRVSEIFETLPRYRTDQPDFLNAVLAGDSTASPQELLDILRTIESELGRDRVAAGWMGPRTIDIDILLYGDLMIDTPELTIPHPRIKERKFALLPLLDIAPDLPEPGTSRKYADCLAALPDQGVYYHSLKRYIFF